LRNIGENLISIFMIGVSCSTWCSNIPSGALPGLTPSLQRELANKAYRGEFQAVQNTKHVWRNAIQVGDSELVVVAVQTQP